MELNTNSLGQKFGFQESISLGDNCMDAHNTEDALKHYTAALSKAPSSIDTALTYFKIATVYHSRADFDTAIDKGMESLRILVQNKEEYAESIDIMCKFLDNCRKGMQRQFIERMQVAETALKDGRKKDALHGYFEAGKLLTSGNYGKDALNLIAILHIKIGCVFEDNQQYDIALHHYLKCAEINPEIAKKIQNKIDICKTRLNS